MNYHSFSEKDLPLISIIMPVYNACAYLVPSLDSILNQTYKNWELIAIDDCSSDDSYLILRQYALMDSRIKVYKNIKNLGVGETLDKGVKLAKGKYIARMDSDDVSYPERLEKQLAYLLKNLDVIAVGGQCRLIDENSKVIGMKLFPTDSNRLYELLYNAAPIQHPTLMVNTNLLPKNFTWYDGWRKAQDVYLFFKLVNYGKLANLEDVVLDYRYYRGGNSLKNPKDTFRLTKTIRWLGKTKFGYSPSLKARVLNLVQTIIVAVLPNFAIFWLFKLLRETLLSLNLNRKSSGGITVGNNALQPAIEHPYCWSGRLSYLNKA